MNRTRAILSGLVALHLAAHVLILYSFPLGEPGYLDLSLFMLGPAQASLLAIWIAFGPGKIVWRVVPTAVCLVVYLWLIGDLPIDRDWLILTTWPIAVLSLVLLPTRLAGLRLLHSCGNSAALGPLQFSIRDMLAWMTALAVVLGAAHYVPEERFPRLYWTSVIDLLVLFGVLSVLGVASTWAALGSWKVVIRAIVLVVAIVGGAAAFAGVFYRDPWYFGVLLGAMAAWMVGSLLVVRWAGYRLAWQWPFRRGPREPDAQPKTEATATLVSSPPHLE